MNIQTPRRTHRITLSFLRRPILSQHFSGGMLVVLFLALACFPLRADTVLTTPPGIAKPTPTPKPNPQPSPSPTPKSIRGDAVCLGKSIVRVDFRKANFDDNLAKLKNQPFLLMGMINGRLVAADVIQTPDKKSTHNKLFFVDLIDSKHASFAGLIEDCIDLVGRDLKIFVNDKIAYSEAPYFNRRGQLLQWTLPPANPKKPEEAQNFILMISGSDKNIAVFKLSPDPGEGNKDQVSRKLKLTYLQDKVLPESTGFSDELYRIATLDCIDLNNFKAEDNTTTYPKALILGCKLDFSGREGYNKNQLGAPEHLLSCTMDDIVEPIQVNMRINLGFEQTTRPLREWGRWENVAGGFIVAPTREGELRYWFVKSKGDIAIFNIWRGYFNCNLQTISLPISFDKSTKAVYVHGPEKIESEFRAGREVWFTTKKDIRNGVDKYFRQYNLENAGPGFTFDPDEDGTVRLNGVVDDEVDKKTGSSGDDKIGITQSLTNNQLKMMNDSMNIKGGAMPVDPDAKLARVTLTQGKQVMRVILGLPYVAAKSDARNITSPVFIDGGSTTEIRQESFNNGVSVSLQLGATYGWTDVASVEFGVKSGFEYKADFAKNKTLTFREKTEYPRKTNDEKEVQKIYEEGFVISTIVKPQFTRISAVVPKADSLLKIANDNGPFFCPAVGMQLGKPANTGISVDEFLCKNPSRDIIKQTYYEWPDEDVERTKSRQFRSDYSPLSDGLLERPFSSLIRYKNLDEFSDQIDKIKQWQNNNPMVKDLEMLNSNRENGKALAGVQAYGTDKAEYRTQFNSQREITISNGATAIESYSRQGYVGAYVESKGAKVLWGWSVKVDALYKGGSSTVQTVSNNNDFTITSPSFSEYKNPRSFYMYHIDVAALKSWMLSHSYVLKCSSIEGKTKFKNQAVRPTFIPKYCWDHDQPFVLGFPWLP